VSAALAETAHSTDVRWELHPLAEVADILDSQRVPVNAKERETRQGSVPYYGATGRVGWIDEHIFDEELVLLGEDGAPFLESNKAKAYVIRGKTWVNNHAHVLRARGIPTGWLAHYLNSIRYKDLVTGTTRLKLTQAAMRQIRVPVAPWRVMENVVAEIEKQFSRLDEAVANLKRVKARIRRYKLALIVSATAALPLVRIGELCGCIVPNRDKPRSFSGDIPWLTLPDFDDDEIEIARSRAILGLTAEEVSTFRAKVVPAGSVLMSCVGRFGVTAVLHRPAVINQQLHAFLPSNRVLPKYLAYALRTRVGEMERKATATTIAYLNKSNCNSILVPLPSLIEQSQIVIEVDRRLSIVREVEAEVDANLKRAQALRGAVLSRAFAGE
jgi:type I restriction enzyme, S subunit